MARHKKPAYLKVLNGSAKHDPGRMNFDAPEPTSPLGAAPDHFTADQVDTWDYLHSVIHPGITGLSDRPSFEVMSILFWRFRFGSSDKDSKVPALGSGEMGILISLMARYGLSPADRKRVCANDDNRVNSFACLG